MTYKSASWKSSEAPCFYGNWIARPFCVPMIRVWKKTRQIAIFSFRNRRLRDLLYRYAVSVQQAYFTRSEITLASQVSTAYTYTLYTIVTYLSSARKEVITLCFIWCSWYLWILMILLHTWIKSLNFFILFNSSCTVGLLLIQ